LNASIHSAAPNAHAAALAAAAGRSLVGPLCGGEKLTEIAAGTARVTSSVYTLPGPSGKRTGAGASP